MILAHLRVGPLARFFSLPLSPPWIVRHGPTVAFSRARAPSFRTNGRVRNWFRCRIGWRLTAEQTSKVWKAGRRHIERRWICGPDPARRGRTACPDALRYPASASRGVSCTGSERRRSQSSVAMRGGLGRSTPRHKRNSRVRRMLWSGPKSSTGARHWRCIENSMTFRAKAVIGTFHEHQRIVPTCRN